MLELATDDLTILLDASRLDWASVEPAIFGTLFERGLDPAKKAQLGAHYTSPDDILLIVEPVLVTPLRRRWAEVQEQAMLLLQKRDAARGAARTRLARAAHIVLGFADELAATRVLDPAARSGNFLYLALKRLLDLEKEAISFALVHELQGWFPKVGPEQLFGIEVNPYAHELAQAVVWIGYIQWLRDNGFGRPSPPILKPLDNIRWMDALITFDETGHAMEPNWPDAEVIIGNPPFLGTKKMRSELGDSYVEELRALYQGRVVGFADVVFTGWSAQELSSRNTRPGVRAYLRRTRSRVV